MVEIFDRVRVVEIFDRVRVVETILTKILNFAFHRRRSRKIPSLSLACQAEPGTLRVETHADRTRDIAN